VRLALAHGVPAIPLNDLAVLLRAGPVDQKRADALEMVSAICAHLTAGVTPLTVSYQFHNTGYHKAASRGRVRCAR
jgi:hypothetical protein